MRSVDLKEFVAGFVAETDDHLRSVRARLMELDAAAQEGRPNPRAVRELFRSFHTIKGLAGMVGVEPIADIAHAVEAVLRTLEQSGGKLTARAVELVIASVGAIEQRLRAVASGGTPEPPAPELIEGLSSLQLPAVPAQPSNLRGLDPELASKLSGSEREQLLHPGPGAQAYSTEFVPTRERVAAGQSITRVRERLSEVGDLVRVLPVAVPRDEVTPGGLKFVLLLVSPASAEQIAEAAFTTAAEVIPLLQPAFEGAVSSSSATGPATLFEDDSTPAPATRVVRVALERLDETLEQLSQAVLSRFRLEHAAQSLAARGVEVRELNQSLVEHARELRKLRASILRLRLVGVEDVLDPLQLLVRGLAAATEKQVHLELARTSAELDKAVAERVFPALVHLVRNAVDHAIEPAPERQAAGKPPSGTIRIDCAQRGDSQLEIRVTDDGRGIDSELVARKAGRPKPSSPRELLELLATPGFSTRDRVTKTSGRGVGVDIVRRVVVSELGGELTLETTPGVGTTFLIKIPLTMAIVDAFTFECWQQTFVVPVSMIEEIIPVDPGSVRRGPAPGRGGRGAALIERRGEVIPLFELGRLLGLAGEGHAVKQALIVRRDRATYAFGVDQLIGQKEVVVRPLEDPLVQVSGVAGATDLGDGRPVLVLDLLALTRVVGVAGAAA